MDFKSLQYFLAIADLGSFSRAAEVLFVSQSSLSKTVRKLESELGVSLFDRSRRAISLTSAGTQLHTLAPALLKEYHALLEQVAPAKNSLILGALPVMAQYGIPAYISAFAGAYHDIACTVREMSNAELLLALACGQCELGFVRVGAKAPEALELLPVCTDELIVALPARHPLASFGTVSLQALRHERFILLDESTGLREQSLAACRRAGFEPNIVYTGSGSENFISLVKSATGVAIFMRRVAEYQNDSGVALLSFLESQTSTLALARKKEPASPRSRAGKLFWEFLRKACKLQS